MLMWSASSFQSLPKRIPGFDDEFSVAAMVWSCIGQRGGGMLILDGTIKMLGRIVKEMMGLQHLLKRRILCYYLSCRVMQELGSSGFAEVKYDYRRMDHSNHRLFFCRGAVAS